MAKEFVMGARIVLKDSFTNPLKAMRSASDAFRATVLRNTDGMMKLKSATGAARDENGRFEASTKRSGASLSSFMNTARNARQHVIGLREAFIGLAAAEGIRKGYDWLVGANADMEQYQMTLTRVMGSQQKAVQTLAWAQQFAAKTPFEIPQIVEATTRLQSYGMNAQKTLGIIGDMSAIMGKDIMDGVEAVADAQTGELERLKEFGITKQMIVSQANKMGINPINKQGQITDMKGFNAALFALMNQRFKGGMDMQSQTFKGMLSNAADFMGTMGRTIGKPLFEKMKAGLGSTLNWLTRLQQNGSIDRFAKRVSNVAAAVWNFAAGPVKFAEDGIGRLIKAGTQFYTTHKPQIQALGALMSDAFNSVWSVAKPVLDWLSQKALPTVFDWGGKVAGVILDVANFFEKNWSVIGPIIEGITAAFAAYYAITTAIRLATMAWAAAQFILDVALNANPIGIIITLIGALIGGIILLVKNWDHVSTWFGDLWVKIKNFFIAGVNGLIDEMNRLIDMLDWIPGVNIKHIGHVEYAKTSAQKAAEAKAWAPDALPVKPHGSHANGLLRVPFDGYIAKLHKGERVLTADEADRYSRAVQPASTTNTRQTTNNTLHVERLIDKLVIEQKDAEDPDKLKAKVVKVIRDALREAHDTLGGNGGEVVPV